MMGLSKRAKRLLVLGLFLGLLAPAAAQAEEGEIHWLAGPLTIDLGENLAQVEMAEGYLFAGPDDTRAIMEYLGNPATDAELGMIIPDNVEEEDWFVVFEFFEVGYVSDADRDEIDAAAILESYREGTEAANREREKMGAPGLHVLGWYEEPHYDENSHNLTWAMLLENDEKEQVVNYNVRVLGRKGYMSAVLVTDPDSLAAYRPEVAGLIGNFSYKQGSRYAEYVKGDKLAKYGLTALIAGGAGAAAVKLGLFQALAKAWKAILAGLVALGAAFWRGLKGIFGTEEKVGSGTGHPG